MAGRSVVCAVLALAFTTACKQPQTTKPAAPTPSAAQRQGPSEAAVVLTVRTTLQPANRTTTHTILIAGTKARSTDEAETWRLYDTASRSVTFINDLERTYRTEPISSVVAKRRTALRRPVDRELPSAEFQQTGAKRDLLGLAATQSVVRLGGYQRELWFVTHPRIPEELFSMMHASAEASTRLGAIVARADEGLIAARGFPLLDRAEMPYGKNRMIVERVVVGIEQKPVPVAMLRVPDGYREVTEPVASRPRASSPPRGQSTPATESQPSATTQTTP